MCVFESNWSLRSHIPWYLLLCRQVNEVCFKKNWLYVRNHNNGGGKSYTLELNEMADWNDEMLESWRRGRKRVKAEPLDWRDKNVVSPVRKQGLRNLEKVDPPTLDWRDKNVVGPVRNQGQCDVCYAFASVAALESAWAVEKHQLIPLSEMQIVDCGMAYGNGNCKVSWSLGFLAPCAMLT